MVAPADASLAILTAAFAPISYKAFAIGAGVFGVPLAAPQELAEMLRPHGIPEALVPALADMYRHGRELLVLTRGQKPVKTRN